MEARALQQHRERERERAGKLAAALLGQCSWREELTYVIPS